MDWPTESSPRFPICFDDQNALLRGLVRGHSLRLALAGLSAYALELNSALRAILDRPGSVDRWLSGVHAFAQSRNDSDEVPLWLEALRARAGFDDGSGRR